MTLDVVKQSTKTALYHQITWCFLLFIVAVSWFYQSYSIRAFPLLFVIVTYLALSITNHKMNNKLVWLCLIPAAGTIAATVLPLASLWYYLGMGIIEKPMNVKSIGAIGIMSMNSIIGIIFPALICWALLKARRNAL